MCTHFTPTQNAQWLKQTLALDLPADYPADTYPGYAAPLVVKSHRSGRVACGLARFGLIPPWAKDDKIGRHTYNARSETVAEKPSYRNAWRRRQLGLVLVDNFYEPSYASGKAVPWKIQCASGEPLAIACLWERWQNPQTGLPVVSFSMLTVNADEHPVMREFHKPGDEKRTPVVIAPELYDAWLGADTQQAAALMGWAHSPTLAAAPA
ncbi:SOS response-associated peptidase [uncultured Limnohabitans sp.]|uniref:SOS response-associated peptidase n=1 Tax=uncultured Limnohabitans sp. TaxID=768543 RepID=UPI002634A98B|nr:SOS response-associated peptidase [uncultured Limnohabitans sp.]